MNNVENQSPLQEFWSFAEDFKSVSAWVAKAAVAAPLADLVLNIGPPWPSRVGVAILLCIAEVLVLMYAFEFWRNSRSGSKTAKRVMQYGLLLVPVAFVGYLWLFASYVEDAPDSMHRVVIGRSYNPQALELIDDNPSLYTPRELLKRFEFDPMAIWQVDSVRGMRVLVLSGWIAFWIALSSVVSAFVVLQWRRRDQVAKQTK